MGLLDKFKKPKVVAYLDSRLLKKIEQSDLWEFLEKRRDVLGRRTDLFYGKQIPTNNIFMHFLTQLTAVNSGIQSRQRFVDFGFSEAEVKAIFGNFETKLGLSNPHRCVKDLVWLFMCHRELARLAFYNGDKKFAKKLGLTMKGSYEQEKWLDWGKSIREFWKDESLKDYRSYIITK